MLDTVLAVLRGYGLQGEEALHATRYVRSVLHGYVALSRSGGFAMPLDPDTSTKRLFEALDAGVRHLAHQEGSPPTDATTAR